jgi:hypothetical protein
VRFGGADLCCDAPLTAGPRAPGTLAPMPPQVDLADPSLYFNRELSWLAFNRRVLEEAQDATQPLLERLKFLAIFGANLDEFMMIRYAGLKEQQAAGSRATRSTGARRRSSWRPSRATLHPIMLEHRRVLREEVLPAGAPRGRHPRRRPTSTRPPRDRRRFWREELFPVLTPLAIDAGTPSPGCRTCRSRCCSRSRDQRTTGVRTAIVQVPSVLPRFVRLPGSGHAFVLLEDVIRHRVDELFPGHDVRRAHGFRVTRDADIAIAEDEADDLLRASKTRCAAAAGATPCGSRCWSGMPDEWRERLRRTLGLARRRLRGAQPPQRGRLPGARAAADPRAARPAVQPAPAARAACATPIGFDAVRERRRAAAPPVPRLRRGAAAARRRRRRPRRAGDQADPLPGRPQLAGRGALLQRAAEQRQAGHRAWSS